MAEIKITIQKGGRVKIDDKDVTSTTAKFTETLANDLGTIEERHVAEGFNYQNEGQDQTQKQH